MATVASQGLSALGLLLLPLLGFHTSDLYSMGLQIGNASLIGIALGLVYNLAIGRPEFSKWKFYAFIGFVFSLVIGIIVIAYIQANTTEVTAFEISVVALFTTGGGFLSAAGVFAVRSACLGMARRLTSVTILPNAAFALAVLLLVLSDFEDPRWQILPAVMWFAGSLCIAVSNYAFNERQLTTALSWNNSQENRHAFALGLGVLTTALFPSLYLAATTQLDPGTTSIAFIVGRLGTAVISLGLNSVLLVLYNWNEHRGDVGRVAFGLTLTAALTGAAALVLHFGLEFPHADLIAYFFGAASWLLLLAGSSLMSREVNAQKLHNNVSIKVGADLLLSTLSVVWLLTNPSITGYFGAFMVSASVTILISAIGLKIRSLVIVSIPCLVISEFAILLGW